MTDKEKYEALVAEIKRLKDITAIGLNEWENGVEHGRMEIINALEEKISSIQKEPVTNEVNEEILILKDQIESLKAARVATQEVHKIELDNLRKQFLENAKSGVVYDGDYIKFDDRTWIDLDPSLSLKPAFELKEGETVKVVILKED